MLLKPLVSSSKTKLHTNSTKFESYSKISNSSHKTPARRGISSRQPYLKTNSVVIPFKNSIKSHINNRMKTESDKSFENLSKIESLRQIDFLPEIVTREDLEKSLYEFQKKYGMTSEKFYSDYKQGKVIDNFDTLKWAILYELWMQKYLMQV